MNTNLMLLLNLSLNFKILKYTEPIYIIYDKI